MKVGDIFIRKEDLTSSSGNNILSRAGSEYDELNKAYIEKCKIDEERCIKEGNVYIKSNLRIGQGTKIYKRD